MVSDKIELKDLVELYVDMQNLFEGLTSTRFGGIEIDILETRRNSVSLRLVEMINSIVSKNTNLRVGSSPFVVDVDTILAEIKKGD